eukprot:9172271-Prorocentrum_lima.AAC.1
MGEVPSKMKDFDNILSFMLLKPLPEKMKGRVAEEAEGEHGGGYIDNICVRYCVGGCCTGGTGGTAELAKI